MIILLARNWWTMALRGLVAVLFGVATLVWPGLTVVSLTLLFGAYALVDGIFALAAVLAGRTDLQPWWALLAEGIVGIAVGVGTMIWPGLTALALLFTIAAWAVVTGVFEIVAAIRLRKEIEGEWLLVLGGLLSILFGVAIALQPGAGALALAWLIGVYALAFGVVLLVLAFRLRNWGQKFSTTDSTFPRRGTNLPPMGA